MASVTFKESWFDTINALPADQQNAAYKALLNYAIKDIEPDADNAIGVLIVGLLRDSINEDKKKRNAGKLGGRPKKPMVSKSKTIGYETENHRLLNQKPMVMNSETIGYETKNLPKTIGYSEEPKEKESSSLSSPTPPILSPQEKEKENYDVVVAKENENPSSTPSSDFIPVGELEDRLLAETLWVDSMLYKFKLDREQLAVQLHTFCREWIERGDNVKTLKDAKRHADSLLNIRQREGSLADPPRWNRFLADLMLPHVDELRYDLPITKAFGEHYMQDVGNGKPYFLGIPHFEEDIRQRMLNFQTTYNDEQPVES